MILIVSRYLIPKGYRGMTIFPFIILHNRADKMDLVTLNHERIHIRQQLELLVIPFFIWYVIEFLIKFLRYKDKVRAYRSIVFEKEAYSNERDLAYLKRRTFWRFLKFYQDLRKKQ